ncbi:morn repeat-containing protein 5 [Holotrichia oblita]|uniref:Morn repeat-containing protein 5 n=1 Tax=Holotrichia oblita TaxID=644536 RepID=A0ACB9T0M6_HOLOL|nr:morn repeat-containing protein 5 [Holotrichia oblita]
MTTRRSRAMSLSADWDNVFGKTKDSKARHPGYSQKEKPPQSFCTGSVYTGYWNGIGMAGFGTYIFPHKVEYEGMLDNSQFHGDGTLIYPMRQKIEGRWDKGKLVSWKYRFIDGLEYEVPWGYCVFPDRRFYLSIQEGLRPAGRELRTNDYVPRPIPEGCYDTGDGFYDPKIKCVVSARDLKKVLRIPTAAEEKWIMHNCRKAWDEPVGYRPDLYKHWTTGRMTEVYDEEATPVVEETEADVQSKEDLIRERSSNMDYEYSETSWTTADID